MVYSGRLMKQLSFFYSGYVIYGESIEIDSGEQENGYICVVWCRDSGNGG